MDTDFAAFSTDVVDSFVNPSAMATGDVDGDGRSDVVVVVESTDELSWFANSASGAFLAGSTIAGIGELITPKDAVVVDLDADGDGDVVVASQGDDKISWFENTAGDGTVWTQHFVVGDFNGDGQLDIAAASPTTVCWWAQTAVVGTFDVPQTVAFGTGLAGLIVSGDFDEDGYLDIVVAANGEIRLLANPGGSGAFAASRVLATKLSNGLVASDIDADGDLDLVVDFQPGSDYTVLLLLNPGSPSVAQFSQVDLAVDVVALSDVMVKDADGDGDIDVLYLDEFSVKFVSNTGAGTFAPPAEVLTVLGEGLLADVESESAFLLAEDGVGVKVLRRLPVIFSSNELTLAGADADVSALGDFDLDGDLDVLLHSGTSKSLFWQANSGGRTQAISVANGIIASDIATVYSAGTGDLDSDGYVDVFVAFEVSLSTGRLAWYRNTDGRGTFGGVQYIDGGSVTYFVQATFLEDVDDDGDLDVVVFNQGTSDAAMTSYVTFSWYANDGLGTFAAPTNSFNMESVSITSQTSVSFGDIDGDGDVDLAVTTNSGLVWFSADDTTLTNFFFLPYSIASVSSPASVVLVDVSGDGALDAIAVTSLGLYVVTGSGSGSFASPDFVAATNGSPGSLLVVDIDGDGDDDAVSDGNLWINSNQTFGPAIAYKKNPRTSSAPH
ncbi:uncharacterized protein AMSG_04562 [Thecamonas trahens ATCC 50062]|uniref:VCBS repeat-containing protein n=1 Tax=Thecamonas trahens ATCC 50062 TaxID=461836 RepID=A0A0L0D7Z6_THETB|nr:hypothetical protein AMSG_04562 [Thecamonas trahens ATCC 50062]KNC48330.1 hypothetical protein AMSG_04562 [Thecamonas trahens ATCC 50062]|eukprot:XP_013758897.1 hypothetical protein AMSG_04562 [Thecamonas trahens ATCC 50062]